MMDTALVYDATGEQAQSWAFHNSLNDDQLHEVIMVRAIVKDLDIRSMEKSIESVIRRHDAFRTFFRMTHGDLKQCVVGYDKEMFSPFYCDMTSIGDRDGMISGINDIINKFKHSIRRLDSPPLVRSCIFKVTDDSHYLCILIHHIISDQRSAVLIYEEIGRVYQQLREGNAVHPEPPGAQLRDYALWQRKWLKEEGDNTSRFWKIKLKDVLGTLDPTEWYRQYRRLSGFPVENNDSAGPVTREIVLDILKKKKAASYYHSIGLPEYRPLTELSLKCKTNICSVITVSLQLLFYLLAGKKTILIAMPVTSRRFFGADSIIGCIGGAIYLYRAVNEDLPVKDFIEEGYLDFLESSQNLIFDHDQMGLDGQMLRINCDVFINFVNKEIIGVEQPPEISYKLHQPLEKSVFYASTYTIREYEDGFSCSWKYNLNLYTPERIAFMVETHEAILRAICLQPEMTIRELMCRIKRPFN